jgi:hypothetical protein
MTCGRSLYESLARPRFGRYSLRCLLEALHLPELGEISSVFAVESVSLPHEYHIMLGSYLLGRSPLNKVGDAFRNVKANHSVKGEFADIFRRNEAQFVKVMRSSFVVNLLLIPPANRLSPVGLQQWQTTDSYNFGTIDFDYTTGSKHPHLLNCSDRIILDWQD